MTPEPFPEEIHSSIESTEKHRLLRNKSTKINQSEPLKGDIREDETEVIIKEHEWHTEKNPERLKCIRIYEDERIEEMQNMIIKLDYKLNGIEYKINKIIQMITGHDLDTKFILTGDNKYERKKF